MKSYYKKIMGKLASGYKEKTLKAADLSEEKALNVAKRLAQKATYALLITNDDGKPPTTRTIQPIVDYDTFEIWMGTNPDLRKVKEIKKNNQVTLAFLNEKEHANLILYGSCEIVKESSINKKFWMDRWILFFPRGPLGKKYVNLHFIPDRMELMSFKDKIVMEPFGLKPLALERLNNAWRVV